MGMLHARVKWEISVTFLVGKPGRKWTLGRPKKSLKYNINADLIDTGYEDVS